MLRRLHNKKGFIFPFAYFVLFAMTIYVAVFTNRALNDHAITMRNLWNIQRSYQALAGSECAVYEISKNIKDWHTHVAVFNLDEDVYNLIPITGGEDKVVPRVVLESYCYIDSDGNYSSNNDLFKAKIYQSPTPGIGTIVVCKGYDLNGESNLYGLKVIYDSHYDYFIFTSDQLKLSRISLDAAEGKIHSNKDVIFGDKATISNLASLTTPEAIRYFVESYIPDRDGYAPITEPPTTWGEYYYWLTDPWVEPNKDGGYRNRMDGHLDGENTGLLMEHKKVPGKYVEYDPAAGNPPLDPDDYPELYQNSNLITTINGNELPNRLDQPYLWHMYWRVLEDFPFLGGLDETPYKETMEVKYTNSERQPERWQTAMENLELTDVLHEGETGGGVIPDLQISRAAYEYEAKDNGMYIEVNSDGAFDVSISGMTYELTGVEAQLIIGGDVVIEQKRFQNSSSGRANVATVIYIDKMMEKGLVPPNGIIYGEGVSILLDNGETLPEGGLTTLATGAPELATPWEGNIYIKGDYNTTTWQPSAAISAGQTYLLSDQFNYPWSGPGPAPDTFHNINYPYEEDFVKGDYNWYAEHHETMANTVDKDYTYVVSLIGPYSYMPQSLELWTYYENPGGILMPPSGEVQREQHVTGSLIRISVDNLDAPYVLDIYKEGYRNEDRDYPGWPDDMGSVPPKDGNHRFTYDDHYADLANPRPPGDFTQQNVRLHTRLKELTGDNNFWLNYCPILY